MTGARILGAALQGVLLGALLFVALINLFSVASGARVFRYENF